MIRQIRTWYLKKSIEKHPHQSNYVGYNQASSFLVLYKSDAQESNPDIKEIVKQLIADGKRVSLVGYVDKKKAESANLDSSIMLDGESLNFWGHPSKVGLEHLLEMEHDVVLDLTTTPVLPLQYVLLECNARLRCGGSTQDTGLLDLVIEFPPISIADEGEQADAAEEQNSNLENQLFNQIIFYLKQIKGK